MVQSLPSTHIEAHVGNVSGGSQVAIGNYIVQIGRVEGGVVNILNEAPPPPRVRPQPVLLRPKPFLNLFDRESETTTLIESLTSQQSAECTGEPGAGKTSLLRHLAHQTQLTSVFPAGVVYFEVNQQSAADLLKSIFDAFYICDFPIKPNETEIRHYLQSVNALVLLDDVEIDAKQVQSLMNVAPNCTFVAVTRERILLGEAVDVMLKGLPTADAVRLFRNELRRTLLPEEEKGAQIICESVACIPLLVLRAAHEARAQNRSLLDVVSESKLTPGDPKLAAAEVNSSSEDEKKVLAALAVFKGTPVAAEHVAAVAGVASVQPLLEDLERRGLVQSHEQQYTLASDVKAQQLGNLKPWFARAVIHLVDWTKERRNQHKVIAGSAAAILLIVKQAVAAQAWNEVRRLGHAAEEALTVSGKWDMWANVLNSIDTAARAQGDIAEQAWVLHQLGTRALLLGDRAAAKADLTNALEIRERLNDVSGAAVTRHNLNILLAPLPSEPQDDNSSDGAGGDVAPTPAWLKIGVMSLVGLAVVTVLLLVWLFWKWNSTPPVVPPKIASFRVTPSAIPVNGQAQLCYEVENAISVRIEPNIGERKPPSKECLSVTPSQTITYTLTAYAGDGTNTSQQITLNVAADVPQAEIVHFEVRRQDGPGGANDPQFQLCYEVRDAAHAEIDNNGGTVVLNRDHCQRVTPQQTTTYTLSATGADGFMVSRQATATRLPALPPQILAFEAVPPRLVNEQAGQLCFHLKDASGAQLDPGARSITVGSGRQCVNVSPLETTTYTLKAFNSEGREEKADRTVTVVRPPAILSFTADPNEVLPGGSTKLCYQVKNARRLQIDGVGNVTPVDHGCTQANVGRNASLEAKTFKLTATGTDGVATKEVSIKITRPTVAIAEFSAEPGTIDRGKSVSLCFKVENASGVGIEPDVTKHSPARNGERVCLKDQPKTTTTYTLTAFNEWGVQPPTRQATVTVNEPKLKHARILFFDVSEPRIKRGESVRLCYGVADANTTTISPLRREFPSVEKHCFEQSPRESTTYVLKTTGEDNQAETRELSVVLEEPPAPPVKITRFDIKQPVFGRTQICYALENARSARIEPGIGELRNLTADCPKLPSRNQQTYTLTATGEDGKTATKSVTYTPPEPPKPLPIGIISFSGPKHEIEPRSEAKLCYSTLGEGRAEIRPAPGPVNPSIRNCVSVFPDRTTDYTLTVTGPEGQKSSKTVKVTVKSQIILR